MAKSDPSRDTGMDRFQVHFGSHTRSTRVNATPALVLARVSEGSGVRAFAGQAGVLISVKEITFRTRKQKQRNAN